MIEKKCIWVNITNEYHGDTGYEISCNETQYFFLDEKYDDFTFCPYCGGNIEVKK